MAEQTRLIVRIETELYEAVKAKAKTENLTVSQVVRHLLREWLKDDPPDEEGERQEKT